VTRFLSETEIRKTVIPALREWIKESGILRVLEGFGIKNYVFLLTGSTAYGHGLKGLSDADLVLIYDGYERKLSVDDFKRVHVRIHEHIKQKDNGSLGKERNKLCLSLKKERMLVSPSGSIKKPSDFIIKMMASLKMFEIAIDALAYEGYKEGYTREDVCEEFSIDDRYPQAWTNVNDKLSRIGLRFGELFIRSLLDNDTLLKRLQLANIKQGPILSEHYPDGFLPTGQRLYEISWIDKRIIDNLYLLKRGKFVFSYKKDTQEKFILFAALMLKICFLCEYARGHFRFEDARSEIKRLIRSGDPNAVETAKLLIEEISKLGEVKISHGIGRVSRVKGVREEFADVSELEYTLRKEEYVKDQ